VRGLEQDNHDKSWASRARSRVVDRGSFFRVGPRLLGIATRGRAVQVPPARTFGQVLLCSGLGAVQRGGVLLREADLPRPHQLFAATTIWSASHSCRRSLERAADLTPRRPSAWLPWRRDLSVSVIGAAPWRLRLMVTGIPPGKVHTRSDSCSLRLSDSIGTTESQPEWLAHLQNPSGCEYSTVAMAVTIAGSRGL
jgi:hypothetical protein